ncbi:hypothetical protein CVT25_006662 [Psilocybe cyanescens]|uniref:F-box domain-containing protein n=1 Tax=Psilocybe cyanescens TaxID=93625 RepID=A0A409XU68_PSICY|nr:hypothetical protein CVT25_006662 [Psilocybe cyanescens]
MDDIPYELWLHITSFLLQDEIWALRSLNKSLFSIAMESRFQTVAVSLNNIVSKEYRRKFLRFNDCNIAMRVHELAYYDYAVTDFPQSSKTSRRTRMLLYIKRYFRNCVTSDKSLAISVVANFKEVRYVKIKFDYLRGRIFRESIPLFHASLLSSIHLQSLSFSYPFELMVTVLPPALFLPHLSSFSMTLFTLPEKTEVDQSFLDTATMTMAPFLNRHRLTLTTVELNLEPLPPTWSMVLTAMSTNFNLSPLFKSLDHIPHLQTLSISISASTSPDCITRFLKIHSHTLRHLTISMTDPEISTTRGVLDQLEATLPFLETFVIQYQYDSMHLAPSTYQEVTLGFIRRHASSLTCLRILKSPHSRAQFLTLLDPLVSYPRLRYLKMGLQILTPEMLDLFTASLPDLYELDLSIHYFKRRHTSPLEINEEYEFCYEIGHHDYHLWKLQHLTLLLENKGRRAKTSYGAAAVAEAMPFLHTFNGITWKQFIREARSVIDVLPQIKSDLPRTYA